MKTKSLNQPASIAILTMVSILATVMISFAAAPEKEFNFIKGSDNIYLYYRWINSSKGYQTRELKAVTEIQASPAEIVQLLKDAQKIPTWIRSASNCRHLQTISREHWVNYLMFSVPWPLNDQDCILRYTVEKSTTNIVRVHFSSDEDYLKPSEGIKRIKGISGTWVITPLKEGKCKLECFFSSDEPSRLPRWATDPIIQNNVLKMMDAFRAQVSH
jgi:hypothetical protein